ncbi:MAG TPA: glycosyltransferase family 1 protein [Chloroflexota bacterium]|nr:glycosyltransferase family 1 protein [Chloroflexota bacterium]
MRIAIDARLISYAQGGISQYTIRLVRALAELGSGDELLLLESRRGIEDVQWPESVRHVPMVTPPHNRFEQITLPMELMRVRPDLIHNPDFIPPFRRNCRSVITIHDLAFIRYPHLLTDESARYYGQVKRAVVSADQIIAVSHSTAQDILELLDADPAKVNVVYSAAAPDCRPLTPEQVRHYRSLLGLPERYLLFVGTLEPRKNLPTLLEAFAPVWQRHGVPLLVVGGKGWLYQAVFETRDRLGLEEGVGFVGAVSSNQLPYYYGCADCLVMPSLYEGFGLPALEAMACRTPVIVSNVSSLPEIVGDAGLTVDPTDIDGLTKALERVVTDNELATRLGRLGQERAAQFSWQKTAAETLAVYRKAAEVTT